MKTKFFLWGLVFILIACTSGVRPTHESLKEAWYKYWSYKKAGDFKEAYHYENISFKMPLETYLQVCAKHSMMVKEFKFIKIGKEGSGPYGSTPVEMELVTSFISPPAFPVPERLTTKLKDYWIKKQGRWYHLRPGATGRFW